MSLEHPSIWNREHIGSKIVWTAKMDCRCFACGKVEQVRATVIEGNYNEELWEEVVMDDGSKSHIYPTLAPPDNAKIEYIIPEDWTQMLHLVNDFYPFEICNAIRLGYEPYSAFTTYYTKVGFQFAEWVCESDDCYMKAAEKMLKEFKQRKAMIVTNGRV